MPPTAPPFPLRTDLSFGDERFLMFVLDEMAASYEERHDDVVRLTLGKSELPPAQAVVTAMLEAAADPGTAGLVHPGGLPLLRSSLAEHYRRTHDVDLPAHRFVVGTGTSSLFRNLNQLLAGPGDEVVLPHPYYPLYPFTARLAGADVRYYRIDPRTGRIDWASLERALSARTRAVVVNSPGNPLGNLVDPEEFLRIDAAMHAATDGGAVLISDEIYDNVRFSSAPFSLVRVADRLRSPYVVTNAFSKGNRMYARRVGYAVVPEWLVEPLVVVQHHTLLTTDPVPQFGAVAALDHPGDPEELARVYGRRRDHTLKAFAGLEDVEALHSHGGFYLTLDCAAHLERHGLPDTLALAERIMERTRVATVPGSDFGLPTTLRLSFSAARYEEAVDRLRAYFEDGTTG
ncbi:pyridoxal phosphate-dependent aminotransferase [Streptomyces sp. NPDC059605]|uniref:pyridoxal phosphate-dependent aminotransferase n=1 Tax=unclassified Streptomyces TaxID=2593676 RepID=UPI003677A8E9